MTPKESENFSNINDLKKEYALLQKKYSLPQFTTLNQQFDIEEISTQTEFLARKIRRTITEKLNGYLRFIELLLNPSTAPLFFFNLVKKLDATDREALTKIYALLGEFEASTIVLDLAYDEKQEADFIIKAANLFTKEIKPQLLAIAKKLTNGHTNTSKESTNSYFG